MSKVELQHGIAWMLMWIGFFGGIALWVWAAKQPDMDKKACTDNRGNWTLKIIGSGWSQQSYYTCDFEVDPTGGKTHG